MSGAIVLQYRDKVLLNDIKLFGFTTVEHFVYRFSSTFDIAYYVLSRLVRNNYLRPAGILDSTKRKFYIPDLKFYSVISGKDTNRISLSSLEHDEYILKLYSIIKNRDLDVNLKLEQEFKKNNEHKNMSKVPDIFISAHGANYFIEYEKTEKSVSNLARIKSAYEALEDSETCFVFVCETEKIAKKIHENIKFKYQILVKPYELLESFKNNNYEKIISYLKEENVRYFLKGE